MTGTILLFKNRYTQLFSALFIALILFFLTRVYLYLSYLDYFSNLTFFESIASFFMGTRVDIAVIFTFTAPLFLALALPFKFASHKIYRGFFGVLLGTIIASIIFFNIGDILYFGFVNRHLSNELSLIGNDVGILFDMAKEYFLLQSIVGAFLFLGIVCIYYKIFTSDIKNQDVYTKQWIYLILIIIIAFLGIRGKITGISFGTSDAFATNKVSSGNLALNGMFCFYRGGNKSNINHSALELKEAVKNVKEALASDKIKYINPEYPMMRSYTNTKKEKYNVVIVMIESFSAKYLDSLSHNDFKVTPTLDKMAKDGILYTNFYANGQRSQEGITSIYTGLTQVVGYENFGEGLELYNPSFLGKIAHKNGYNTIAMQSSDRGSFRVDKLSELAGFEDYYGAKDFPHKGEEVGKPHFGAWDGDMFRFLSSKLHTIKEPFISFSFTATTHAPYHSPGKKWEKYPHGANTEQGYLNTMFYVDSQIDEFMKKAKKEPWFNRTVFIFTADHVGHAELSELIKKDTDEEKHLLPDFRVPLVIYAPKIFKPQTSDLVASHNDIMSSIIDLLGWNSAFSSIGQSLFDTSVKSRFAFVKRGNTLAITDGKGSVGYNFCNFIDEKGNVSKELKKLLLSVDTAEANLLKNSKWMKP